jgi:serine/threonine-protein kinase
MLMVQSKTLDIRRQIKQCPTCGRRFSSDAAFCPFDGVGLVSGELDPLADQLVGQTVDGRYEVIEVLGEGGMGRVYRVRHAALDREFAMKVLRRDLAADVNLAARFMREAKVTASVKHQNVVQITDFGTLPDAIPYFVMELLVGQTLGRQLKGGSFSVERVAGIVKQIAAGLGAAHDAGVIHRDLKPDNVFLISRVRVASAPDANELGRRRAPAPLDEVRVVDFGAAKVIGSSRITRAGVVYGTPHYMSPEQASGRTVDHRSDVYALGVIMYELLTGRVPFEGDTYVGVLTQHMFVQPVPPSQLHPGGKDLGALEDITLICLAKRPQDRFASMSELADAIASVVTFTEGGAAQIARRLRMMRRARRVDSPPAPGAASGPIGESIRAPAGPFLEEIESSLFPRRSMSRRWVACAVAAAVTLPLLAWSIATSRQSSTASAAPDAVGGDAAQVSLPGRRTVRSASAAADKEAPGGAILGAEPARSQPSVGAAAEPETPVSSGGPEPTPANEAAPARGAAVRTGPAHRPRPPPNRGASDDVGDPFERRP